MQDSLSSYLKGLYWTEPLEGSDDLFIPGDGAYGEIDADKVRIVGVDFDKAAPIPAIKAEAAFTLQLADAFTPEGFEAWQTNNEIGDGLSFYWDLPEHADLEDLDLTYGDHLGVECLIVDEMPF